MVVGWIGADGRSLPFAARWSGSRLHRLRPREPSRGFNAELFGVSCASATACTAVGRTFGPSDVSPDRTLVERWNGKRWSIQRSPNRSAAGELNAVSCFSASACVAVGDAGAQPGAGAVLAEAWNGSKWTLQPSLDAFGAYGSALSSVSCASVTKCLTADPDTILQLGSRGGRWSVRVMPRLPIGIGGELSGVSCVSGRDCLAVGSRDTNFSSTPLIARWNGVKWSEARDSRRLAEEESLSSVSCGSATVCAAVSNDAGDIAELDGSRWSVQADPTHDDASLIGVSCARDGFCMTVGSTSNASDTGQLAILETHS
jgi:hypothetical protein